MHAVVRNCKQRPIDFDRWHWMTTSKGRTCLSSLPTRPNRWLLTLNFIALQRRCERQSMPWKWWPLQGGVHWFPEMRDWKKRPFWLLNIETYFIQGICERICSNYFTFAAATVQTLRLGPAWLECFCFFLGGGGGWALDWVTVVADHLSP